MQRAIRNAIFAWVLLLAVLQPGGTAFAATDPIPQESLNLARQLREPGASRMLQQPSATPVHLERRINTDELGLPGPIGLTYSFTEVEFYFAGTNGDRVIRFSNEERAQGEVLLDAPIPLPGLLSFDATGDRLLSIDAVDGSWVAFDGAELRTSTGSTSVRGTAPDKIGTPRGMAVNPQTGTTYILAESGDVVRRVSPTADRTNLINDLSDAEPTGISLRAIPAESLGAISVHPTSGHVFLATTDGTAAYEIDDAGTLLNTFDLTTLQLAGPTAMVFAPSGDSTDDPANLSLYLADGSEAIVEANFSLASPARLVGDPPIPAILVQNIATSNFNPPSPDAAGITYDPSTDRLIMSDSEVEETPLFTGVNLWTLTRTATVLDTANTLAFTNEPTGLSLNTSNNHLFVTDDLSDDIYEVDPGSDGQHGTTDDVVTLFDGFAFGANDAEGVAYDSLRNELLIVDGLDAEVYRVNPGPNGLFDGVGDVESNFDVAVFGMIDPEGIAYDAANDRVVIVDRGSDIIVELSAAGSLIQTIDFSGVTSNPRASGIVLAPGSVNPSTMSYYVTDRGIDNDIVPSENDGRLYEFATVATGANEAPTVGAGPDSSAITSVGAFLDGTIVDDGLPDPPSTTSASWSQQSGPAGAVIVSPTSVDTNVTFTDGGTYVFRLTADDTELSSFDEVTITASAAGSNTLDVRVNSRTDDAEERGSGAVSIGSGDLEMVFDAGANQTVGLRFVGLGIPQGAIIEDAWVQFQTDETNSGTTALSVAAQSADNPPTFSTVAGSISARPLTTNSVAWVPSAWSTVGEQGPDQRTPALTAVVQEVVDRPGWSAGNAMVFVISGTGERVAEAYVNAQPGAAALLHVVYNTAPPNTAPSAVDDAANTPEAMLVNIDVAGNDTDPESNLDLVSITIDTPPANGVAVVGAIPGTVDYTPNAGFFLTDTFVYEICDTGPLCDTATVTITIDNTTPTAVNDIATTPESTLVNIIVVTNDTDPENNIDPTTAVITVAPTNGMVGNNGDGSFNYTPLPGFLLTDTFTYEVCDIVGLCDSAAVSITVTNAAPIANNDSTNTSEAILVNIDVAANDTDGNLDLASITIDTAPANGVAVVGAIPGTVDYTPNIGFFLTDTFVYQICDTGLLCDTATVTITIDNTAPTAVNDTAGTAASTLVTIPVADNDTDAEDNIDLATVTIDTAPANGTAAPGAIPGTVEYTPNAGFFLTDTFVYETCDTGLLCGTATVTITIDNTNPLAVDDSATTAGSTLVNIDVAGNDADPESNLDLASITIDTPPTNGTAVPGATPGTVDYTPDVGFFLSDTLIYEICDTGLLCATATVTITIDNTNPLAVDDSATTAGATLVNIDVAVNDTDPESNLDLASITIDTPPTNGTAVTGATPGTVDYTPNVGFFLTDTFVYEICDTAGLCGTATVTVTVENTAPTAVNDTASTAENALVNIDVAANDTDADSNLDPSTVTITIAPTNGIAVLGATAGTVDYTPNAGFFLSDTFTYEICDTAGLCHTAEVTITVDNTAPSALDDTATTPEATVVNIDVAANDTDLESNLDLASITIDSAPTNGTAVPGATPGTVDYTPDVGFFLTDTFTYQICDTGLLCGTATVTITIDNTSPVAVDDTATTSGATLVTIDVATNDSDPNGNLDPGSITIDTAPTNGSAVPGATPGTVDYTPDVGFFPTDTFIYQICDLDGLCDSATVTVTIENTAPTAVNDTSTTAEATLVTINVTGNDTDPESNLDPTTAVITIAPTNGMVGNNGDGSFNYTPLPEFFLTDSFTYEVCDLGGLCDTALVTITVENTAPSALDDTATTPEATVVNIDVASNDTDLESNLDLASITIDSTPTNGTTAPGATPGTVDYTPDVGFFLTDTFVYRICDTGLLCSTATVTVTIDNVAPTAVDDTATTGEDTLVNIDVAGNDSDPNGNLDLGSITITTAAANGTAVPGATAGTVDYTPNAGHTGTDTFVYQICDTDSSCATATVTIVTSAAPTPDLEFYSFTADTTLPGGLAVRDEDVVAYDRTNNTWMMHFDGTDVGISGDVDAIHVRSNGSILMSFAAASTTVPGLVGGPSGTSVDDSDIVLFTPSTTGEATAGAFSFHFDASDIGMSSGSEDIVAVYEFANGDLAIAASGNIDANGLSSPARNKDIVRYSGSYGSNSAGSLTMFFDGSDVDVSANAERIDGITLVLGETALLFSSTTGITVPGVVAADEDVTRFTGTLGPNTSGVYSVETDFSTLGVTQDIDGISIANVGPPPPNQAPVANNDTAATNEDTLVNIDVAENDADTNLDLGSISVTAQPANGTAVPAAAGTVDYTPNNGHTGPDTFTYQICDTEPLCDTATVTVTTSTNTGGPDTDAPTTTFVVPLTNNAVVSSPGQLEGTVSDVGGSGISEVQIAIRDITNGQWVDGDGNSNGGYQRSPATLTNQTTADADWEFNIDLPVGIYRIYARPVDITGNIGIWANLRFRVQ